MKKEREWAKTVAEAFIIQLDPEYIKHILTNKSYIIPVIEKQKLPPRIKHHIRETILIENKSIEVLNHYYTQLIREELCKLVLNVMT